MKNSTYYKTYLIAHAACLLIFLVAGILQFIWVNKDYHVLKGIIFTVIALINAGICCIYFRKLKTEINAEKDKNKNTEPEEIDMKF